MKEAPFSFLGRQPIFNRQGDVIAYSILFRQDNQRNAKLLDSREVYAKNLDAMIHSIGIDNVIHDKKGWIKIDDQTLIKSDLSLLPKERIVFELTATSHFSMKVSHIIADLIDSGFSFALPYTLIDEILLKRDENYLAIFDYIVFNVRKIDFDIYTKYESLFKRLDAKLLAARVETKQGFDICKRLGFDYFLGYFFEQPTILKGKKLSPNRSTFLSLLSALQNELSNEEIVKAIRFAPDVSLLLLKYINAADINTKKEINSIEQAVSLMGRGKLLSWVVVMLFTAEKSEFNKMLLDSSIMRAKLMEEFCIILKRERLKKEAYLVGLLSLSDAIFRINMRTIVTDVPFEETITKALVEGEGELGKILKIVLIIEKGNFKKIELISKKLNLPIESITGILKKAFAYVDSIKKSIKTE